MFYIIVTIETNVREIGTRNNDIRITFERSFRYEQALLAMKEFLSSLNLALDMHPRLHLGACAAIRMSRSLDTVPYC